VRTGKRDGGSPGKGDVVADDLAVDEQLDDFALVDRR
jgi:hypothetical protein